MTGDQLAQHAERALGDAEILAGGLRSVARDGRAWGASEPNAERVREVLLQRREHARSCLLHIERALGELTIETTAPEGAESEETNP